LLALGIFVELCSSLFAQNVEFDQTSAPVGIVSQTTYPLPSTTVSTVAAPTTYSGYSFTGWTVSGTRMADPSGCAINPATFVINGATSAVANYVPTTQDSLGDGIPDWWKLYYFGSLSQGAANLDPFGDGYTNAMDYANGTNPNVARVYEQGGISRRRGVLFNVAVGATNPTWPYGGISRRRSATTTVVLNTSGYSVLQQLSSPAGIISQTSVVAKGSTVNLVTPPDPYNGYRFTGWLLNGVRYDQPTQNQPIPVTITANTTIVARYVNGSDQTAGDALPDWQELFLFNTLGYGPNDDPIGDGFTIAQDQIYGFSPVVVNQLQMGGISRRRSATTTVILNNANYSVLQQTSSPQGIISQSSVVANGSTVNLVTPPNPYDGYYFTGWLLNGVRYDQPTQNQPILITVTGSTNIVAQYINGSTQTAGDVLPDWQEWFYFNGVGFGPNYVPNADSFTIADDLLYGFSLAPAVENHLQMGGVSRRRSVQTAVNAVFLPNPPAVGVNAATNITKTSVQLSAMVNPIGSPTTAYFQWGLTGNYGNQTATQDLGNGLMALSGSAGLTGLSPGTLYHFQIVAANAQGTTLGGDSTFSTLQNNYQIWAATYGLRGPLEDPARDGVSNLMKFATGIDPTGIDPTRCSKAPGQLTLVDGVPQYSYTRADAAMVDGITFVVEWSDTLAAGSWRNAGVNETILSDNGVVQQVSVAIPAGSNGRRFVRLRVIQP